MYICYRWEPHPFSAFSPTFFSRGAKMAWRLFWPRSQGFTPKIMNASRHRRYIMVEYQKREINSSTLKAKSRHTQKAKRPWTQQKFSLFLKSPREIGGRLSIRSETRPQLRTS